MIVIGVDVHKPSLTAVAVDEVGREVGGADAVDGGRLACLVGNACGRAAVGG